MCVCLFSFLLLRVVVVMMMVFMRKVGRHCKCQSGKVLFRTKLLEGGLGKTEEYRVELDLWSPVYQTTE